MPWLRRELQSRTVESSDDATKIVKLPKSGFLSGLMLRIQMTNGATSGRAVSMLDVVDKVEVLANGDRPIYSLYPDELLRWQRYLGRTFDQLLRTEAASGVQEWYCQLPFGRFLGDPNYFLPLGNFSDLELRVAYSPSIAADGGFTTGTFALTVVGYMMDTAPPQPFSGFFRRLNKYNITSVASGDLEIELPRGNPYEAIMVYAHESGVAMHTDISDIKLELNDGALIWMDGSTVDLCRENQVFLGLDPEMSGLFFSQAAETMETYLDYLHSMSFAPGAVATIGTSATPLKLITSVTGGLITPQGILKDGDGTQGADIAENADSSYRTMARGVGLGKAVVIDFADYIAMGQPFDSNQWSKIKLVLTQAGAGAQVRVSLGELVQQV